MKSHSKTIKSNTMTNKQLPTRIQRSRNAGSTTPANTKYCGRPGKWGNPFVVNKHNSNYYRVWVNVKNYIDPEIKRVCFNLALLKGTPGFETKKDAQAHAAFLFGCLMNEFPKYYRVVELAQYTHLSCWCALEAPCHVDEIIERMKK